MSMLIYVYWMMILKTSMEVRRLELKGGVEGETRRSEEANLFRVGQQIDGSANIQS